LGGLLIVNKFWGFFLISFVLQFIIFAIVNTFLRRKDFIETTKVINEQLEATSKYIINITCAYCQTSNPTPVILNQENRFKCSSCNQINGIKMQFFATQITTPLKKITMIPDEEREEI
jgi:transposase-like protein